MHAHAGHGDHAAMVADFRRRFWLCLALTPPVLLLSPMIQHGLGLGDALRFRGDGLVLFALSTVIYVYGGRPFLTGFWSELRNREPGMMTLVAVAISARIKCRLPIHPRSTAKSARRMLTSESQCQSEGSCTTNKPLAGGQI